MKHTHPAHGAEAVAPEQAPAPVCGHRVQTSTGPEDRRILTIRTHSGLSGDMLLAGLARMTATATDELDSILHAILPELAGSVRLVRRQVQHIGGWHAEVSLPQQHEHRTLADITAIITACGMCERAKQLATETFTLLAKAEAFVHGRRPEEIRFHEVGALDSILDICTVCALFVRLDPACLVVSPLPVADGSILCAHGTIPAPAPAVLELLPGIPVRPFSGEGETVTPTAAALLRVLGATFGAWPAMMVEKTALVYGTRIFPGVPNGAVFACGRACGETPSSGEAVVCLPHHEGEHGGK